MRGDMQFCNRSTETWALSRSASDKLKKKRPTIRYREISSYDHGRGELREYRKVTSTTTITMIRNIMSAAILLRTCSHSVSMRSAVSIELTKSPFVYLFF